MVDLSFLLLTHNRPTQFIRCVESILQYEFPFSIEIVVNNDSCDITEIIDPRINYSYYKSHDISDLYRSVYERASGKYVYFIEDDDFITDGFYQYFSKSLYDADMHICLYDILNKKIQSQLLNSVVRWKAGKIEMPNHFQLSQMVFKKILDLPFPSGNEITNDVVLYNNVRNHVIENGGNISFSSNRIFHKTIGNDNMSKMYFERMK